MVPPRLSAIYALPALALTLLAGFALLRAEDSPLYTAFTSWITDGRPEPTPFGDLQPIFQAAGCWRHGVNVYVPNACMGGGIYNYLPLLLRLAYLPLDAARSPAAGLILLLGFVGALGLMPPPGSGAEFCALVSPGVLFGLEQANFDVAALILAVAGIWLLGRGRIALWLGYAAFLFAAACKIYPITLLVLAWREPRAIWLSLGVIIGLCLAAYEWYFGTGLHNAIAALPWGPPFGNTFGASDLPFGLVLLALSPHTTLVLSMADFKAVLSHPITAIIYQAGTRLLWVTAAMAAILAARRRGFLLQTIDEPRRLFLLGGAALITGCFIGAQNIDYRSIFLLLTLPGLCALARHAPHPARARLVPLIATILFLLWDWPLHMLIAHEGLAPQIAHWLLRELAWWWVIYEMMIILAEFLLAETARLLPSLAK